MGRVGNIGRKTTLHNSKTGIVWHAGKLNCAVTLSARIHHHRRTDTHTPAHKHTYTGNRTNQKAPQTSEPLSKSPRRGPHLL